MYTTPQKKSMKRPYTTVDDIKDTFLVMQKGNKTKHDFHQKNIEDDDEFRFMKLLLEKNKNFASNDFGILLGNYNEIIIVCNTWLLKIAAQHNLSDDIFFRAIYILYRYLVKGNISDFVKEHYLFAAVCLNIANKIDTVKNHLKPSKLITNEHKLQQNSVLDMIRVERLIISHLEWEFTQIQPPHTFFNSCYLIFDMHPKIMKTAASCAKKCILSNFFMFFSGVRLSLYCLLASFIHHRHFFYYDEIINIYSINESNEEIKRIAEEVLKVFKTR